METPILLLFHLLLLTQMGLCIKFSRYDFPSDFVFGAATSAFQYEGAVAEDGRTPSVLDDQEFAPDKSNANVTSDGYHKYKGDIKLMNDVGLEAYRFSLSWSRLIPNGRGIVNPKGVEYYNRVLDELIKQGIQPHVTLNHLDHPQVLQDEYGGWLNSKIVDDFKEFADVCFREFGDRVYHWTTMDEPNIYGMIALRTSNARNSLPISASIVTDTTKSVYPTIHNMLIAHSEVVKLYRTKYQKNVRGLIGINVYSFWCQPFSNSSTDVEATERVNDFIFGWILNPVIFGEYPEVMKKIAGPRLPSFTKSQSKVLMGSFDFIGLNYYVAVYVSDNSNVPKGAIQDFKEDLAANLRVEKTDPPARGPFVPDRVPSDFSGLPKMMSYLKKSYGNLPIYIHENGLATEADDLLDDTLRIKYLKGYIGSSLEAIRNGIEVRGYFVWSFIDVFEFLGGYKRRFGLYHVDFKDADRRRMPKISAHWYSNFLKNNISVESNLETDCLRYSS